MNSTCKPLECLFCQFYVVNQYHIAILCPQSRQESQVTT